MRRIRLTRFSRQGAIALAAAAASVAAFASGGAASAASSIAVSVTSDFSHSRFEAQQAQFNNLASFSVPNACAAGVCKPAAGFEVSVHWGDGSSTTCGDPSQPTTGLCGTVSTPSVSSGAPAPDATTGVYEVSAAHIFPDEFNCPTLNCGFPVNVAVTELASGAYGNGGPGHFSVFDQRLDSPSPAPVSLSSNGTFKGVLGTFHDDSYLASSTDIGGGPEYSVAINWGDGTPLDTQSGSVTVNRSSCGSSAGSASGQGCTASVSGSHAYHAGGRYTITVTVTDGASVRTQTRFSAVATVTATGGTPSPKPTPSPSRSPSPKPLPSSTPSPSSTPPFAPLPRPTFGSVLGSSAASGTLLPFTAGPRVNSLLAILLMLAGTGLAVSGLLLLKRPATSN